MHYIHHHPGPSTPEPFIYYTADSQPSRRTLKMHHNATRSEASTRYRDLTRKYHPDKWDSSNEFSLTEVSKIFKYISNAFDSYRNKRLHMLYLSRTSYVTKPVPKPRLFNTGNSTYKDPTRI